MACSSAAWVLGGVRLISSASTTLAKIGPFTNRNARLPVVWSSSMISVPVMSLGMRSGVNCTRLKRERQRLGHGVDHQRLGQAGHADEQGVAAGEDGGQDALDDLLLPDDAPRHLGAEARGGGGQLLELFDVGRGGTGDGHFHSRSGSGAATGGRPGKLQGYLAGATATCAARRTHRPSEVRTQVSVQTTWTRMLPPSEPVDIRLASPRWTAVWP